ncbi:hypothetical protein MMC25_002165 [Agyrium rufum]|nr:hypothetical protein [Agyrium rufum]
MDAIKNTSLSDMIPPNPFYPEGLNLVGFIANDMGVVFLIGFFLVGCAIIVTIAQFAVRNKQLTRGDSFALGWFVMRYFSVNHQHMAELTDFFGQAWKEYAYADSRYLTKDAFVLCMETCTAFLWGPLSFVTAYWIATNNPMRFPLQALVSIGQMYGDILYYMTALFDLYDKDIQYCRPEPYYFWFYYFFINFIWMMIPGYLLYDSFVKTAQAFTLAGKSSARGSLKKTN